MLKTPIDMTGRSNVHIKAEVERFPSYYLYCGMVKVFILLEIPVTCFHEKKYKNKKPNTTLKEDLSINQAYESMIIGTNLINLFYVALTHSLTLSNITFHWYKINTQETQNTIFKLF